MKKFELEGRLNKQLFYPKSASRKYWSFRLKCKRQIVHSFPHCYFYIYMEKTQSISTASAIEEWVKNYSDDLYRWALHKTSDKETAEDLVQEAFLAACRSLNSFQGKSQPKAWLIAILNNKIADHHRKQFKVATINTSQLNGQPDGEDAPSDFFDSKGAWKPGARPSGRQEIEKHLLDDPEFLKVLGGCLKKLPGKWSAAIHLKYMEEKGGKEICQELRIAPTNFWQILHRAKIQLRACLEQNWFKS